MNAANFQNGQQREIEWQSNPFTPYHTVLPFISHGVWKEKEESSVETLAQNLKSEDLSRTDLELAPTPGSHCKSPRKRARPIGKFRSTCVFRFLDLPLELQSMILEICLVTNAPIQPLNLKIIRNNDVRRNIEYGTRSATQHRQFPGLVLPVLRVCKELSERAIPMMYSKNILDFSQTQLGAISPRHFRKVVGRHNVQLVRHAYFRSRDIDNPFQTPVENLPRPGDPYYKQNKIMLLKETDIRMAQRLNDGFILAHIANHFRQLRTLVVKLNIGTWNPHGNVHFELFGPHFRGMTVILENKGIGVNSKVWEYDATGALLTDRSGEEVNEFALV